MHKSIKKIFIRNVIFIVLLMIFSISASGCSKIDDLKVKLGLKNTDFEYIKQNKIQKIVIQNTRDQGFRFVVTDQKAISELYDILSTAKPVNQKSTLSPDYVFELDEGSNKIHTFNYIAGLDKKDAGNLYSDDKIYIVSKRIDNDIIKSFWTIRKPKDFNEVYYNSLIQVLQKYDETIDKRETIGVNLNDDIDSAKFILSADLEDFKNELSSKVENAVLISNNNDNSNYPITMKVVTQGYKTTIYKAVITFYNKHDKSEKKYYIVDQYDVKWNYSITDKKPDKF